MYLCLICNLWFCNVVLKASKPQFSPCKHWTNIQNILESSIDTQPAPEFHLLLPKRGEEGRPSNQNEFGRVLPILGRGTKSGPWHGEEAVAQRGTNFTSLPGLRGLGHLGDHSPLAGESRVSVDSYETSSHTRVGGQTLAALVGFPTALHR